jgi:hypothetical protein
MNFILHSKVIKFSIHATALGLLIWFLFPNLFTHRDRPIWPIFANSTVEGVDRNKNGLRDDVEVRLHRKINDDQDYLAAIKYAAAIQRRLTVKAETRSEGLEIYRNESCNHPKNGFYSRNPIDGFFEKAIFNTKARIDKERENVRVITASGPLSEYICGSTTDRSEERARYMIKPKKK